MTPIKEFGEFVLADGTREYFFRPSFSAMMRIGDPEQIVETYSTLHSDAITPMMEAAIQMHKKIPEHQRRVYASFNRSVDVPLWASTMARFEFHRVLMSAVNVLQACCEDDLSEITGWAEAGKTGRRALMWKPGRMPVENIIVIARNLMIHGVIGKAKVRKLQRHEEKETTTAFNAFEYIVAANNHFGMSRERAEQLTMTEFALLLSAKYPNQKGFTREEYDAVMDDDDRRWAEMMKRQNKPA